MTTASAAALADRLREAGRLPTAWAGALAAAPRERFVPDHAWVDLADDDQPDCAAIDRESEPGRWLEAVYSDRVVVTQFDDGATAWPGVGFRPTSSCSMPSLVLAMLDALDVHDGMRVLEVGTGTGWNAGLLSARLGDERVTSVEIDSRLAEQAQAALDRAGFHPTVVAGDGAAGWPLNAPHDRVIATAAVKLGRVPHAWVEQTRPGGVVLAPVKTDFAAGRLVRFEVGDDGTAVGRACPLRVGFMELRDQRTPGFGFDGERWDDPDADLTATEVQPWPVLGNEAPRWAVAVAMPHCRYELWKRTPGRNPDHGVAWLADPLTGSWASVVPAGSDGQYAVRQSGPRRLWDEAEAAWRWWRKQGEPSVEDWEFRVNPERQTAQPVPQPA